VRTGGYGLGQGQALGGDRLRMMAGRLCWALRLKLLEVVEGALNAIEFRRHESGGKDYDLTTFDEFPWY
jgi:hypothetical protein